MPKYKVPPDDFGAIPVEASSKGKKYYPTVYFPVSKAIIDQLKVGKAATVTLKGTVKGLESRESDASKEKHEVRLEIREVEMYAAGTFEELAEDDDEG